MALKTFGSGWDPNDSLAPDNSGAPPFQDDVDLPPWQGGGKGFGGGGSIAPSQGTTLSTTPPAPNRGASGPGFGVGGGWRSPHVDPATGQPEMLTGPGGLVEKTRGAMNPFGFIGGGNPYWRSAIAGAGAIAPTPAETGELSPRFFTGQGVQPGLSAPQGTPYEVPRGMPGRAVDAPQTYPHMPWPDTGATPGVGSAAPAVPPPRPGSAVTAQRPDLGTYAAPPPVVPNSPFTTLDYRPNSGPNERNRGSPVATALDLSRFFGGGQPAPAATPAAAPVPYPPPRPKILTGSSPGMTEIAPGPTDPSIIARQKMRRPKSSSSSQGGGF